MEAAPRVGREGDVRAGRIGSRVLSQGEAGRVGCLVGGERGWREKSERERGGRKKRRRKELREREWREGETTRMTSRPRKKRSSNSTIEEI